MTFNVQSISKPSLNSFMISVPRSSSTSTSRINDLCSFLGQSPHSPCNMGHLDHQEFEHRVSMGKPSDVDQAQEMLCFSDILGHKGAHCLGVKDKYAASYQVCGTNSSWNNFDMSD